MKILFVVNDIDFFISHRLQLAIFLTKKDYKVYVLANKIPEIKFRKIKFLKFDLNRSSTNLISNLKSIFQLNLILKSIRPNLVHSITLKPILFSSILLLFNKKIKLINAISGLGFLFTKKRKSISKTVVSFLFRIIIIIRKPFFIFQNEDDYEEFKNLGLKKEFKIIKGSGVDKNLYSYTRPVKKEKLNITFTGRILKDKGIIELIEAVKLLHGKFKNEIILNIYGKIDKNNPAYISEKKIHELLIPGFIIWHGFTNSIKEILIHSDIYCLPSYREGIPKSIVEAMAIGRPIVTTNAPGCNDTVENEINGFKVSIEDTIGLSKKLQLLIENESLRIEMGKKSRKLFEKNFTLERVLNQTLEIYEKVMLFS